MAARLSFRNSAFNPDAGSTPFVYDLAEQVGTPEVGVVSNTSVAFAEVLRFQMLVGTTIIGTSFPISVNVTSVDGAQTRRYRVQRLNAAGVVQASSAYSTTFSGTGVNAATLALSTMWAEGDILAVSLESSAATAPASRFTAATQSTGSWVDITIQESVPIVPVVDRYRKPVWYVLARPYDPTISDEVEVRLTTSGYNVEAEDDAPAGYIPGLIEVPYSVSSSLLRGNRIGGHAVPSFGDLVLENPDGVLDWLLRLSWQDRDIEFRLGYEDQPISQFQVKWIGEAQEPSRADRETIVIPIRGLEDVFDADLQRRKYAPGYEPYVALNGTTATFIDHGNTNDITTATFWEAVAFRTTASPTQMVLAGKKNGVGATSAGYHVRLQADGNLLGSIAGGGNQVNAVAAPSEPYNSGARHVVAVRRTSSALELYHAVGEEDLALIATTPTSGLNLSNAVNFRAGANGAGGNLFIGEIERYARWSSSSPTPAAVSAVMQERYPEDVDLPQANLVLYAPLTENFGTSVGDLGSGGVDGTINGSSPINPEAWTGTPNGNKDVEGKPVPILIGRKSMNPFRWVDRAKLIAQAADTAFFSSITSVREGFVPLLQDTTTTGSIFQVPPEVGKWRWQTGIFGGNEGAFIRMGNLPLGTMTFSAEATDVTGNPQNGYPGTLVRTVVNRVASSAIVGMSKLNADAPYVCGHYWDEAISARSAIDEVLASAGAYWTVDPRTPRDLSGKVRVKVFQLRDPSGEVPDATYRVDADSEVSDFAENGFEQRGIAPVYRTVTLKYRRYSAPLGESEPRLIGAEPVSFELIHELSKEWRTVVYPMSDSVIVDLEERFRGADDEELATGVWVTAHARTEAKRQWDLHAQQVRIFDGKLTGYLFDHWIGDVIFVAGRRLLHDDLDMEVTLAFIVLGADNDSRNEGTVVELWGGFEA